MRRRLLTSVAFAVTIVLVAVQSATTAVGVDSAALRTAVTTAGMQVHLAKFQKFGQASTAAFGHPTRVDGSLGFTKSVDYVAAQALAAGYQVTVQPFTFDRYEETAPAVFERTSPTARTYALDSDFATMEYSGSGDVTAPLTAVGGIMIPSPGGSTSGCSSGDFAGFPTGNVALIQRGTCTFRTKADNAKAAGASGVVIFNEGDTADRSGLLFGTLSPPQMSLPVIGTSFAVGRELYDLSGQAR